MTTPTNKREQGLYGSGFMYLLHLVEILAKVTEQYPESLKERT